MGYYFEIMTNTYRHHRNNISLEGLKSSDPKQVEMAVTELYERYYPAVSGYLMKRGLGDLDIQDVFQDGIMTFLRALNDGKVKEGANVGGYFFTICKHLGMKRGEKNARMATEDIDFSRLEEVPEDWEAKEADEERQKLRSKSWALMDSLGQSCQELLKRAFEGNQKIMDFFAELGYKNAQVARTAKYKCLQRLKKKLSQDPQAKKLINTLFHE